MSMHVSTFHPKPDKVLADIADYVSGHAISSKEAYDTARLRLMDTHSPTPATASRTLIDPAVNSRQSALRR